MSTNHQTNGKGLQLLLAAVPLLISFLISIISYFASVFIQGVFNHEDLSSSNPADDGPTYLINYITMLVVFGFWYMMILQNRTDAPEMESETPKASDQGRKKSEHKSSGSWNPVKYWSTRLPVLLLLGFGIQVLGSAVISILSNAAPDLFSSYKELIQSMSGSEASWMTVFSVSLLAPIAEELLFRGVALNYAKRALPVKAAIFFQAVLFGIYHLNLVQFVYATLIGTLLGMLAHRAGSVIPGIVLHVIINVSAYLIPAGFIDNIPKASLSAFLALCVVIACCIALFRLPKKKSARSQRRS